MKSEDDGYVHRPGAARDADDEPVDDEVASASDRERAAGRSGDGSDRDSTTERSGDARDGDVQGVHPESVDRSLGGRGWVLIAVLAFSLLGAPLLILFRPPSLPYWVALLALPMLPAILLGAVGVWATTRPD